MIYPYKLPDLGYAFDALEPYIDKETMIVHYTKHHQTYINNLNAIIEKQPELQNKELSDILTDLSSVPSAVRTAIQNQGGGSLNHTMFWTMMSPKGGGIPKGHIGDAITKSFGNFEAFQDQFNATAKTVFGSGWAWLAFDPQGRLVIVPTPNQDTPLSEGYKPIICLDVWEHAYYLKYQNRRPDYISAWWHVIDWSHIDEIYQQVK